jgi:D-alanine-D-alanine ligase
MKIGYCYNIKPGNPPKFGVELDYDSPSTIRGVRKAIEANGYEVVQIKADTGAFEKLKRLRKQIDLVFNLAEGVSGDARESQIPIFCEVLGIPYTHSSPTVNALTLDKLLTKLAVTGLGARVPKSLTIKNGNLTAEELKQLDFPIILKPNKEGSSSGVFSANVVKNAAAMLKRGKQLRHLGLVGDMLAEEYIDGREFTVGVWGNGEPEVLPIVEQRFDFLPKNLYPIAGYELKWIFEDKLKDLSRAYDCPAKLTRQQQTEIEQTAKLIYTGLGVRDVARLDFRMDKQGRLYFLEINTLPGIIPGEDVISYFPVMTRQAGFSYTEMVEKIIGFARKRYGI